MKLQHFMHKHPLIINEFPGNSISFDEQVKYYSKIMLSCTGCGEAIVGSCVCCQQCSFRLHNSCAKLPRELQLPIHDKNPLVLQEKTDHDKGTYKCNHCNLVCQHFFYHCTIDKFVLDVKCASSLQPILEVEIHNHPLAFFQGSISFTCNYCGKKGEDKPCQCALCGIWFHRKCAFLSHMVKHMRHKHPLELTKSLKTDQSEHRLCQFCVKKLDTNYGSYYCSSCDYVVHLDCAMDEVGRELKFEPIKSTTRVGKDKIGMPLKVKHFSHEHDLKLTDECENYEICDGCIRPIFPPFYKCAQCSFFLHKSCVELPVSIQYPLHSHMLFLRSRTSMLARCDACELFTNGFTYVCNPCQFELDVSCSLIPENFTHVGHEHSLILSSTILDEKCSACNYKTKIFCCTKCEFTLDFGCATLPLAVKHKQHEHFFTLRYTAEDDSGEYYCDICEKERDSKFWFYYCDECSFSAHPKCIFGEFLNSEYRDCRNIKFGNIYYTSDIHQHPLTLARKTMDHDSCDKCGKFCNEVAYECATCNSIIQVEDLPNCKTSLMDFPVNQKQVAAELERRNRMAELERINEMERMERINEMKELMEGMERQERELMKWRKRMEGLERMEPLKGMERDRKVPGYQRTDNFYEESIKAFVDKYK
ncbi:uncharacterized protein LOC112022668 isoform X1 [Quercus suber]|uniref:uncharacterized protein LOC112022668 isoform X1 n=1 Tax=Quercus suber TaxID=58331 RepID=UPI0032DE3733